MKQRLMWLVPVREDKLSFKFISSYLIYWQLIRVPLCNTITALVHHSDSYVGAFQGHHTASWATYITCPNATDLLDHHLVTVRTETVWNTKGSTET
jgi:hypothetical protein